MMRSATATSLSSLGVMSTTPKPGLRHRISATGMAPSAPSPFLTSIVPPLSSTPNPLSPPPPLGDLSTAITVPRSKTSGGIDIRGMVILDKCSNFCMIDDVELLLHSICTTYSFLKLFGYSVDSGSEVHVLG